MFIPVLRPFGGYIVWTSDPGSETLRLLLAGRTVASIVRAENPHVGFVYEYSRPCVSHPSVPLNGAAQGLIGRLETLVKQGEAAGESLKTIFDRLNK